MFKLDYHSRMASVASFYKIYHVVLYKLYNFLYLYKKNIVLK